MLITFWGVRGSIPSPLTPKDIQEKITAVVQRIQTKDLASPDAMQRFIASLPAWIFGTVGGNTPCVELCSAAPDDDTRLIFDAGSGLRVLGKDSGHSALTSYNILLSHFHWDHIQGLPFFDKAYNPKGSLDIYSPFPNTHELLAAQMHGAYYPVELDSAFTKNIHYHIIQPDKDFTIGKLTIRATKMKHPGDSYSYCVRQGARKFIYATDAELDSGDFIRTKEREEFFSKANIILLDAQYTLDEALAKEHWGHSAFSHGIDFAAFWGIKKVVLFHHDPTYSDKKLYTNLEAAKRYILDSIEDSDIEAPEVSLAIEGTTIEV